MNLFFQIALGLVPVLALFVLLSVFVKKSRATNIVMASVIGCLLIASVVCRFAIEVETVYEEKIISSDNTIEQIDVIYSVAESRGDYEYALELLKGLRKNSFDSAELTQCEAYLNAATGDWKSARVLYEKAVMLGLECDDHFMDLCSAAYEESKLDYAASDYFENLSAKPDALYALKTYAQQEISARAENNVKEVASVGRVIGEAKIIFDKYLQDGTFDSVAVEELVATLNKATNKKSELLNMDEVRRCRARLLILGGNYSEFAETIDEDSTYDELAIASELCMKELVEDEVFTSKYTSKYKKKMKAVRTQLVHLRKKVKSAEEKQLVKDLIEKVKAETDPSALEVIANGIAEITLDEDFTDIPKAHIQLAKIAYERDDEQGAKEHISSALNSLGFCEDEEFYVPLGEIARVINNKDSGNDLKNVPVYVEGVLNNTCDKVVASAVEKVQNDYEDDNEQESSSFDTFLGDVVSQMRISLNITDVNTDNFAQISATVNIDDSLAVSAEELKQMITVTDCGIEITDFTVEKIEYKAANILLCCDVSGSMSGTPIYNLREAVKKFVQNSSDKENIALVAFDSDIVELYDFGTDKSVIISAADALYDRGGTNMYGAVIESIKRFNLKDGELNYILLLSDGEDNDYHSYEDIQNNIGIPCIDNQIILYSLGLGNSVNIDYMDSIASSTNGEFVYIADSETVDNFYDYLRSQMLNQYVITFEAKDTLTVNRTLKVHITEDPLSRDSVDYSLDGENNEEDTDSDEEKESFVEYGKKGIYGLDTGLVYKSKSATTINIKGFGFEKDDVFTAELNGILNYDSSSVKCEYVDETTVKMTIPGGIACGKYDVRISVGDLTANIKDGIMVVTQGSEKNVNFGPYVFTAYEKIENGNSITLSGMVNMNGWLNFRGDITLEKMSYDARNLVLIDNYGSYVSYYTDTAEGIAKTMAKNSIKLSLPALGNVTLVNDSLKDAEAEDYPVNPVPVELVYISNALALETPGLSLYPNRLELKSNEFSTELPLQEKLLKSSGYEKIFKFEVEITGVITNKTIGVKGEFSNNTGDDDVYSAVNFGSAPIYLSPAKYKVKIDTVKNEYSIDFSIKVAFINNDGMGFYVEWKERETDSGLEKLWPNEVLLKCDYPIKASIGPVPVTYSDFKLGLSDIDPNKNILDWKFVGRFDLSTTKMSDIVPGLKDYIGDPSVLSLDDNTIEFSLGQRYFSISTELKLLEKITLGKAKIEAGKIPVTSILLGFENDIAAGMRAELTRGIEWHIGDCDFEVSGTGILHLHNRFAGVEFEGKVDVDIKWYIFKVADFSANGVAAIGVQFDNGLPTFVIKAAKDDDTGYSGYYLIWNEITSLDYGKLEV